MIANQDSYKSVWLFNLYPFSGSTDIVLDCVAAVTAVASDLCDIITVPFRVSLELVLRLTCC